ncbi:MAG: S1 RNA-binding domain-containing protein, partial [Myxococcales bacterium]|nr:S1 RNA-binding domain-containing protein [Myxococcales bacterium]
SIVKIGEEVRAKVIGVTRDGKNLRNVRISLSLRALKDDPWDAHKDLLVEGGHATGKVVSLTDFGAFVELAEGIEGLLHISELGKDLKHASLAAKEGDEVRVAIERVDRAQRRISLCKLSPAEIQAIDEGTFDAAQRPKSLKPGSHIKVVVGRVDHAGVQVQVRGVLGKRGRGFITLRDLGSLGAGDTRKSLAPGSEIDVKIVGVDRRGGLKCSVKGMETDAERQAVRDYKKETAKQSFGTFGDLLRTKLAPDSDSNG